LLLSLFVMDMQYPPIPKFACNRDCRIRHNAFDICFRKSRTPRKFNTYRILSLRHCADDIIQDVLKKEENSFLKRGRQLIGVGNISVMRSANSVSTTEFMLSKEAFNWSQWFDDNMFDSLRDTPELDQMAFFNASCTLLEELNVLKMQIKSLEFFMPENVVGRTYDQYVDKYISQAETLLLENGGELDQLRFGRLWRMRFKNDSLDLFLTTRYRCGGSIARLFQETGRVQVCSCFLDGTQVGVPIFSVLPRADCPPPILAFSSKPRSELDTGFYLFA